MILSMDSVDFPLVYRRNKNISVPKRGKKQEEVTLPPREKCKQEYKTTLPLQKVRTPGKNAKKYLLLKIDGNPPSQGKI